MTRDKTLTTPIGLHGGWQRIFFIQILFNQVSYFLTDTMIVEHQIISPPTTQKVLHAVTSGPTLEVDEGIMTARLTI